MGDDKGDNAVPNDDQWDRARARALRLLAKTQKPRGIIKPTEADSPESRPRKTIKFNLTLAQQQKENLPNRGTWEQLREEKRRRKTLKSAKKAMKLLELEKPNFESLDMKPVCPKDVDKEKEMKEEMEEPTKLQIKLPAISIEQTVEFRGTRSEFLQSAGEFLRTAKPPELPDNVDDYIIITEYRPRCENTENIKLEDDVEVNENKFFGFWRRLIKLSPKFTL